jgi:hypothetical protein
VLGRIEDEPPAVGNSSLRAVCDRRYRPAAPSDTGVAMSRKPQCLNLGDVPKLTAAPLLSRWSISKLVARQTWIDEVEAVAEAEAVEKAAARFELYAKLVAVPRPEARSS